MDFNQTLSIKKIQDYLEIFGLPDKAHKRVHTFSGGMKRRLNLIAALLHDPTLLILDEPTAGVDVQSRNILLEFLMTLKTKTVQSYTLLISWKRRRRFAHGWRSSMKAN